MMKRFTLFLFIFSLTQHLYAQTAIPPDGNGSQETPYLIASVDNLYWLSLNSSEWNKYFKQTANIDATDTQNWDDGNGGAYEGFLPIGDIANPFSGSYDGDGHRIDGLAINRPSSIYIGLFGYTSPFATIKRLGLTNAEITGNSFVGALVGYNGNSTISECFTMGSVNGSSNIGGIVGYNIDGILKNNYSTATVNGTSNVGGIVGYNHSHTVENNFSTGQITGTTNVGGIVGYNSFSGLIINSFWNTETSGLPNPDDGVGNQTMPQSRVHGKTSSEMRNVETFTGLFTTGLTNAWDFFANPHNDNQNEDFWHIDDSTNSGFPFLTWENSNTITICMCNNKPQHFLNAGTTLQILSLNLCDVTLFHLKTQSKPNIHGSLPSGIYHVAPRYWTTQTACSCNPFPFFSYSLAFDISGLSGITDYETLTVLTRSDSNSAWQNIQDIGGTLDFSLAPDTIRVFVLSTHHVPLNRQFTIGGGSDNPLPVELAGFSATPSKTGATLNWTTHSETDNLGFILYRDSVEIGSYVYNSALKGHGTALNSNNYTFTDDLIQTDRTYTYQLESVDNSGLVHSYEQTVTLNVHGETSFALDQNYPNPFNPETTIQFNMKSAGKATLRIFNITGQVIYNETLQAEQGLNSVQFNGSHVSSGVYFYQLVAGNEVQTKKMMLVK